jgi:hypothetical protein
MEQKSPNDVALVADGWTRQFSASEPRLSEAVESYQEIGMEVRLEPVDTTPRDGACNVCVSENPEYVKVIYTRPRPDKAIE